MWEVVGPPSGRYGHSLVLDPVRNRLVLFGGSDGERRADVWCLPLDGPAIWTRLEVANPIAARYRHSAIYDPLRDRILVHGGNVAGNNTSETMALSLSGTPTWTHVIAANPPPPPRREHTAIYDAARDRMIVYGGYHNGAIHGEAWALSLSGEPVWAPIAAGEPAPAARYRHVAIHDPVRERMIVHGGRAGQCPGGSPCDTLMGDTWALSLSEGRWSRIDTGSAGIEEHVAIYDAVHDRMLVQGGAGPGPVATVSALSLGHPWGWTPVPTTGPFMRGRHRHAAAYDPRGGRMIVVGGMAPSRTSDTWCLDLASRVWSGMVLAGTAPSPRTDHSAVYDPDQDQMVVFGGFESSHGENDAWALSLGAPMRWSKLAPAGTLPPRRMRHGAVYDPVGRRMIVFGGYDPVTRSYLGDTWALHLAGTPWWSPIVTALAPAAREPSGLVYDSERRRVILFGGVGRDGAFDDVWSLELGNGPPSWTRLQPSGAPPSPRTQAGVVHDPARDRILVVGGHAAEFAHDLWALSLEPLAWTRLPSPAAENYYRVVFDPVADRLYARTMSGAAWERRYGESAIELADPQAWSDVRPPSGPVPDLLPAGMIYDPHRDRVVFFGGNDDDALSGDTWTLTWGRSLRPAIDCGGGPLLYGRGFPPTVHGTFGIRNPFPTRRRVDWRLWDERGWVAPRSGTVTLEPSATTWIHFFETLRAQQPERVLFSAWVPGGLGDTCARPILDATTAVTASIVSARIEPGRAVLRWHVREARSVVVQRRDEASEWRAIAEIVPDAGLVALEDSDVAPGRRYGYRLAWDEDGREETGGETWLETPAAFALAIEGVRPNPARQDLRVALTLPRSGTARIELVDVAGRRVAVREERLEAGRHLVPVSASLEPGIFLVRLGFDGEVRVARAVVVR